MIVAVRHLFVKNCRGAESGSASYFVRSSLNCDSGIGMIVEVNMFVLMRAITYASLFIGVVLIYLPVRVLSWSGIVPPQEIGVQQIAGMVIGTAGAAIALWCIYTFASIGRGTPLPLDPPRRLVVQGPYRFVRNPMYFGAALALIGAGMYYHSSALLAYTGMFLLAVHLSVIGYEEPTLRQTFGQEYEAYCRHVGRWWPRLTHAA
jgi:protein-S-isoprenylcysteine O-methyltransferase Ste14